KLDQAVEDAEIALLHRDLEGLHVQPVAGEHALGIAPLGICRRTPAASLRFVNDVVVNQSCGVNDLDHRSQADGAAPPIVEKFRGEQEQTGTNSLAATAPQVFANLR